MLAERISSSMSTERDSGTTLASISGISASKTGRPSAKAAGAVSGLRKRRATAPVK